MMVIAYSLHPESPGSAHISYKFHTLLSIGQAAEAHR